MTNFIPFRIAWLALLFVPTACMAGAGDEQAIAPFVGAQTWVVARADLSAIDFDAVRQSEDQLAGLSALKQFDPDLRVLLGAMTDRLATWSADFKKAGGRTIWAVAGIETDDPLPTVLLVVPLSPGSDTEALTKLLRVGNVMEVVCEKDALVARPRGSLHTGAGQSPRPDLAAALAAAGNAPLEIAIAPPPDGRRVLETMIPPLPAGQPVTVLTQGFLRASIVIDPPPNASAHLIVQSEDSSSAEALRQLMASLAPSAPAEPRKWDTVADFSARSLAAVIGDLGRNSRVRDSQVTVDLSGDALGELTASLLANYELELRVNSSNHMLQLLQACFLYANNRGDHQFPASLEAAVKSGDLPSSVLVNPRLPHKQPGYVYIRPREGEPVSADRMMVYENFDEFGPGINVGFGGDGHVEWIANKQAFEKLLQIAKAGERN